MEWFGGSINEAIGKAKSAGALFVVAVHGPGSEAFMARLDEEGISGPLKATGAVAIKIDGSSDLCKHFSALYPVLVIPALYLIDAADGLSLEVCAGSDRTTEAVAEAVAKALAVKEKRAKERDTAGPSTSAAAVASPRAARVENAQAILAGATATPEPTGASAVSPAGSLEERVARAKQLLAQKRAQKEAEEQEKEINSEMERREVGRNMSEMKRRREEEEATKLAEERRKDKEEERAARERVRQQIEQDRQERAAKWSQAKEEELQKKKETEAKAMEEAARLADQERVASSNVARVQFRLPDGRSKTTRFEPDDKLECLYAFVRDEITLPFRRFSLSTAFPTRQLDAEDRATVTLRALGLVPSATVLVMPQASSSTAVAHSAGGLLQLILTPFTYLWSIVSAFLFPANPNAAGGASPAGASGGRAAGRPFGREGNVARLRSGESDEDENNTYNGNSTQQM